MLPVIGGLGGCAPIVPPGERAARSSAARPLDAPYSDAVSARQAGSGERLPESAGGACLAALGAAGTQFRLLGDVRTPPDCSLSGGVQIHSMAGDTGPIAVTNLGPAHCDLARALAGWARYGVDRAARQILGRSVVEIQTMGSFACRNVAGTAVRSAHARAAAVDVSGFVLSDGRKIVIAQAWHGADPATREFLRVVRTSACKRFGVVLGPSHDAAHHDHFHLELASRRLCS
jgi:hypothetical protein